MLPSSQVMLSLTTKTWTLPTRVYTADWLLGIPITLVAINVALAFVFSYAFNAEYSDSAPDEDERRDIEALIQVGKDHINLVTTSSITIVALTFSLTVLSIQIASQSYSPRLLDDFIKDPKSRCAVGINLGAFSYSYTLQYILNSMVWDGDGVHHNVVATYRIDGGIPYAAVYCLSLQMLLVVLMFLYFIHHFVNGLRLEKILSNAVQSAWKAATELERENKSASLHVKDEKKKQFPKVPDGVKPYKVVATESGYVSRFTTHKLLSIARTWKACIIYHVHVGEYVASGTLLAYVWSDGTGSEQQQSAFLHERKRNIMAQYIISGIELSQFRAGEYDVSLGVQQLSDIATRALSPGINDPHSAVQALDSLSTLFGKLTELEFYDSLVFDDDGKGPLRVAVPRRSFGYLLSIVDPVRVYGCTDLRVCLRLLRFYGDLGARINHLLHKKDKKRMTKRLVSQLKSRLCVVFAQLEQCKEVFESNFEKESASRLSIQRLYEQVLTLIAYSDQPLLDRVQEPLEMDLDQLETTYEKPSSSYIESLPESLKTIIEEANLVRQRSTD